MTRDDDTIRRLLNDAAPASHGISAESVARRAAKAHRRRSALTLVAAPVATLATIAVAVAGVEILREPILLRTGRRAHADASDGPVRPRPLGGNSRCGLCRAVFDRHPTFEPRCRTAV